MNLNTKYAAYMLTVILLLIFIPESSAQVNESLICTTCEVENHMENKFCINCGESLEDEYSELIKMQRSQKVRSMRFISERVDPPRLFTVPVTRVLGSLDISLMGGGAFGAATDKSFLGTIGIGLGNIAEVEFSTVGLVTNITRGSTVFPTSAFKLTLIPENKWYIPSLSVAIRSSSNWQGVQSERGVLEADGFSANAISADKQIRNIGYHTRFTTMYGVSTLKIGPISLHGGLNLTDVRVKDLTVDFYYTGTHADSLEKQKNLFGGFLGFDIEANPETKLMFEIKTVSNYQYNVETKEIDVSEALLAIGGVRFFFTSWLSTDVGVWYQSTFMGIADMQIKMGLNVFIPVTSMGRKARSFFSGDGDSEHPKN